MRGGIPYGVRKASIPFKECKNVRTRLRGVDGIKNGRFCVVFVRFFGHVAVSRVSETGVGVDVGHGGGNLGQEGDMDEDEGLIRNAWVK